MPDTRPAVTPADATQPRATSDTPGLVTHRWTMPFGAMVQPAGGVCFRLWAPAARQAELVEHTSGEAVAHTAQALDDGWYEALLPHAAAGTRYQWRIDGELDVPDPASRFNPEGPHGPSEVVDAEAFAWDRSWQGRPWAEAVIYEMHVGTFTAEGTYAAAEARLDELAATGITALELMPLSDFPGRFGWGYDGVLPYAPHAAYGSPEELKHFIQAAHRKGLMVFLDVVYNHFGPDGNYLGRYAPQFFSQIHKTPWGNSLNFDREGREQVRAFFVENALYWLHEYRFDGLRLDAVHAIVDDSSPDVVEELARRVRETLSDRHVHLILENENNGWHYLPPGGGADAQWNDDFHHVMYVALSGDTAGYYQDFGDMPVKLLARSLTQGYVWQGAKRSSQGARDELVEPPPQPLGAMVNFLNNHDQSGNRAFGERFSELVPRESLQVATALTLLSPATPMLFAGEEFDARTPFLYFADWQGELRDAVTEGRLRDFGHFAQRADGSTGEPPGACEVSTFESAKLDWAAAAGDAGRAWRTFVCQALAVRRQWFAPRLDRLRLGAHESCLIDDRSFLLRWRYEGGEAIELQVRLAATGRGTPAVDSSGWPALVQPRLLFAVGRMDEQCWGPWSARWTFGQEAG